MANKRLGRGVTAVTGLLVTIGVGVSAWERMAQTKATWAGAERYL